MRSNISHIYVTPDNIRELMEGDLIMKLRGVDIPEDKWDVFLWHRMAVWDPWEKYQIKPNYRGFRQKVKKAKERIETHGGD